jgi:hypothetical protein
MADDVYRITIKGHLDSDWSEWFDGLTIRCHPDSCVTVSVNFGIKLALSHFS